MKGGQEDLRLSEKEGKLTRNSLKSGKIMVIRQRNLSTRVHSSDPMKRGSLPVTCIEGTFLRTLNGLSDDGR